VLKQAGFAPAHILDVGANHGNWTRAELQFFPEAQYTLLEPQEKLKVYVQDLQAGSRFHWINAGASETTGTLPFHLSHRDDSSTFLQAAGQSLPTIPVRAWALDDFLAGYRLPVPEMVKVDAEGFDLKVLRGPEACSARRMSFWWRRLCCAPSRTPLPRRFNSWRNTASG